MLLASIYSFASLSHFATFRALDTTLFSDGTPPAEEPNDSPKYQGASRGTKTPELAGTPNPPQTSKIGDQ